MCGNSSCIARRPAKPNSVKGSTPIRRAAISKLQRTVSRAHADSGVAMLYHPLTQLYFSFLFSYLCTIMHLASLSFCVPASTSDNSLLLVCEYSHAEPLVQNTSISMQSCPLTLLPLALTYTRISAAELSEAARRSSRSPSSSSFCAFYLESSQEPDSG